MDIDTLIQHDIKFYDHRGKYVALLAPGSSERDVAERIKALRDEGVTYADISSQSGLSLSSCHRYMNRLLLTESVETGGRDKELRRLVREHAARVRAEAKVQRETSAAARTARKRTPAPVPQAGRRTG